MATGIRGFPAASAPFTPSTGNWVSGVLGQPFSPSAGNWIAGLLQNTAFTPSYANHAPTSVPGVTGSYDRGVRLPSWAQRGARNAARAAALAARMTPYGRAASGAIEVTDALLDWLSKRADQAKRFQLGTDLYDPAAEGWTQYCSSEPPELGPGTPYAGDAWHGAFVGCWLPGNPPTTHVFGYGEPAPGDQGNAWSLGRGRYGQNLDQPGFNYMWNYETWYKDKTSPEEVPPVVADRPVWLVLADPQVAVRESGHLPPVPPTFMPGPPRRGTKERKLLLNPRNAATRIFGAVTEIGDAVDCFFKQLDAKTQQDLIRKYNPPKHIEGSATKPEGKAIKAPGRGPGGGTAIPLHEKLKAVWDNFEQLDKPVRNPLFKGQTGLDKAIQCVAVNHVQDRFIGKLGRRAGMVSARLSERSGVRIQLGLGPAI